MNFKNKKNTQNMVAFTKEQFMNLMTLSLNLHYNSTNTYDLEKCVSEFENIYMCNGYTNAESIFINIVKLWSTDMKSFINKVMRLWDSTYFEKFNIDNYTIQQIQDKKTKQFLAILYIKYLIQSGIIGHMYIPYDHTSIKFDSIDQFINVFKFIGKQHLLYVDELATKLFGSDIFEDLHY